MDWWTRTSVLEIVLPLAVRHKAAPPCMCSATDSFTCSESIKVARRSLPKPDHLLPRGSKPVLGVLAAEWSIRGLDTFAVSFPGPTNGSLALSLGSTITSGLKPGRYCYDILLNSGTAKTRVVEGSALVTAGITTA